MLNDLRYAMRMLRKNPGFTIVAVVTIALGIGANTALFSLVNSVLLRPLPFNEPDRLALIWHHNLKDGNQKDAIDHPTYLDYREQSASFASLAAVTPLWRLTISTPEGPEQINGLWVSDSFFEVLGIRPLMGRAFKPEEDRQGGAPAVILSHAVWQNRFSGDPAILGRAITISETPVPVVGVMPAGFHFQDDVELWMPLGQNPVVPRGRPVRLLNVVGRLAAHASLAVAEVELLGIARRLQAEHPDTHAKLSITIAPLHEHLVGKVRLALYTLLGAVGFVLLIACVNVANLLMSRAAAREKEVAIRAALGAGRVRLLRQFLTESVLLALIGGTAGFLIGLWGIDLIRGLGSLDVPRIREVAIDARVLVFTALISLGSGLLFGIIPGYQLLKTDSQDSLKEGGRTSLTSGRRIRSVLVISEVALALVMLVGAGLMLRSFGRLMNVNPGFEAENVLTLQLSFPSTLSNAANRTAFYASAFERLEALPGVVAAGGVTRLPLGPGITTTLEIEGRPLSVGERPEIDFRRASANYFRAMGIALKEGRVFTASDNAHAPLVSVVTEAAVRRYWPGEDAIGKRVRFFGSNPNDPWFTIVGVVEDVRHYGLDKEARPEIYMHFDQGPPSSPLIAIRATTDPLGLVPAVRRELRALENQLVISNIKPMEQFVRDSVSQRRFSTVLLGAFGAVAILLAALGIYGVLSYAARQRTHEIGIRLALGAGRRDIFRLVIGQGMILAILGIALGLAGAIGMTRFLTGLLFGVSPLDPPTFVAVCVLLVLVSFAACYIPARRATRVAPMEALRYE